MNIYKGLLFLHGHLLHPDDIGTRPEVRPQSPLRRSFSLFETLMFLGGRPMHPDRPFDREEPFELLNEPCCGH